MSRTIKPLKRYGQNFLIKEDIAEKIIDALELKSDDVVLEIGPGKGILTKVICDRSIKKLIAVELDQRLVENLKNQIKPLCKFEIINSDFLQFRIEEMWLNEKIKVVGNIPYNLTSEILFKLIDSYKHISKAVLMVQKEVGERILANPGVKEYGILSVIMGLHGKIEKIISVEKENFYPIPKVDSMVIGIDFFEITENISDYKSLRKLITEVFQMRRKMLRNCLRKYYGNEIIAAIKGTDLKKRPEQLSVSEYKNLANELYQIKKAII